MTTNTRCGYIAIVGRPNVGKSTLLNKILQQKISITARRPQTTRHTIVGIKTINQIQMVFIDTPGLHRNAKRALNRYMNRSATAVLHDVAVIVWVIDALSWTHDDELVMEKLQNVTAPVLLVVNKIDRLKHKNDLLPLLQKLNEKRNFAELIPLSAKNGSQVEKLENVINKYLPVSEFYYDEDQITNRNERFLASEFIREKLFRLLGQELPYAIAVMIDQYQIKKNVLHVDAIIWVERTGQKSIVIGKNGELLKKVGTTARRDIEEMSGHKVFLRLWVKVKENWADDESYIEMS